MEECGSNKGSKAQLRSAVAVFRSYCKRVEGSNNPRRHPGVEGSNNCQTEVVVGSSSSFHLLGWEEKVVVGSP